MLIKGDLSGTVVKKSDVYTVIDNTHLNNLVVSKTVLHPGKATSGHKHPGQEEVYHFIYGEGNMLLDGVATAVRQGDIVLVEDGVHHKVQNTSEIDDLVFVCVFDGKRSH